MNLLCANSMHICSNVHYNERIVIICYSYYLSKNEQLTRKNEPRSKISSVNELNL